MWDDIRIPHMILCRIMENYLKIYIRNVVLYPEIKLPEESQFFVDYG